MTGPTVDGQLDAASGGTVSGATIIRPNGKPYRPRKLSPKPVADRFEDLTAVVVFGTHDPAVAKPVADRWIRCEIDSSYEAYKPERVWWRDGMENGLRTYVPDEVRGRAGVLFQIGDRR